MAPLAAWLLALMVHLAPPERLAAMPQWPGWEETAEQKRERYGSIAEDIAAVVHEDGSLGPRGRARAASVLLALAFMEGGLAADVDRGPCVPARDKRTGAMRCDGLASASLWQIKLGAGTTSARIHGVEGLSQGDLFADRRAAARVALHMVRRSFRACPKPLERLNVYAGGACHRGQAEGRARLALADRLFARGPIPMGPSMSYGAGARSAP